MQKRILFISDMLAVKNSGANALSKAHMQTIIDIYGEKEVDVISLGDYKSDSIEVVSIDVGANRKDRIINMLQGNYYSINNKSMNYIINIISNKSYDIIFIDNSMYGKLVKRIKATFNNVEVITFYHDIKRNLAKQWLKEYGLRFLPNYIVTIKNEKLSAKYSDKNITLNSRESNVFRKYYNKEASFELPIYIKDVIDRKIEDKLCGDNRIKLLFVGVYYYPNIEGIKWFVDNVLNYIDNCELYIVGRGMEQLKDQINSNKVKVLGTVDDIKVYYEECDAVVAPIFSGAGMKVKTAEALMYGKSIFGTKEAFEGYDIEYGEYAEVCNSADEFINSINMYIDKKKLKKESYKSRKIFEEKYSEGSAIITFKNNIKKYME